MAVASVVEGAMRQLLGPTTAVRVRTVDKITEERKIKFRPIISEVAQPAERS
jgi:hypothetical protein